jgi:hypothetical protein
MRYTISERGDEEDLDSDKILTMETPSPNMNLQVLKIKKKRQAQTVLNSLEANQLKDLLSQRESGPINFLGHEESAYITDSNDNDSVQNKSSVPMSPVTIFHQLNRGRYISKLSSTKSPTFKERGGGGSINPFASLELIRALKSPKQTSDLTHKLRYNKRVYRHFVENCNTQNTPKLSYKPNGFVNTLRL